MGEKWKVKEDEVELIRTKENGQLENCWNEEVVEWKRGGNKAK